MNITENLVIREYDNPRYPRKPFVLWIVGNGPVGDKFNVDSESSTVRFPPGCTDNMATLDEAIEAYDKFLYYVKDKIKSAKGKKGKASYRLWT